MDEKQTRALGRLIKRLNAVRQTLRSDERGLLDRMVEGSFGEVAGHQYRPASIESNSIKEDLMLKKVTKPAAKPESKVGD